MRHFTILLILLAISLGASGCIIRHYESTALYYPPELGDSPYIPGVRNSLKDMLTSRPKDEELNSIFNEYRSNFPSIVFKTLYDHVAFRAINSTAFSKTEQYVDFVIASMFSSHDVRNTITNCSDKFSPFLRVLALNAKHYSEKAHRRIAERLFCGKFASFIPPDDALMLYYALVSIYGMDWMNSFVDDIYLKYGQVLLPYITYEEFVPNVISKVIERVKKAPPMQHRDLLKSVGFAYTGRTLVPTQDIQVLYNCFPCKSYAHELLARGCFDILEKEELWLKYRLEKVPWPSYTLISPILFAKYPLGYESMYEGLSRISSKEIYSSNIENGIHSPEDLRKYILEKRGIRSNQLIGDGSCFPLFVFRLDYRNRPQDVANMLAHGTEYFGLDSDILDPAVLKEADMGAILHSLAQYCKTDSPFLKANVVLSRMLSEGVFPSKHFGYYFSQNSQPTRRYWSWNSTNSYATDETTILSFLRFFGDRLVWNDTYLQFEWKSVDLVKRGLVGGR